MTELEENIQTTIGSLAGNLMNLINDQETRNFFMGYVVEYLGNLKDTQDIVDFSIVCDDTNNTPEVIDRNGFVADIEIMYGLPVDTLKRYRVSIDRRPADFTELLNQAEENDGKTV